MPTHHKNYKKSTKSLTKRKSRITKKTKKSKKLNNRTLRKKIYRKKNQKGGATPMQKRMKKEIKDLRSNKYEINNSVEGQDNDMTYTITKDNIKYIIYLPKNDPFGTPSINGIDGNYLIDQYIPEVKISELIEEIKDLGSNGYKINNSVEGQDDDMTYTITKDNIKYIIYLPKNDPFGTPSINGIDGNYLIDQYIPEVKIPGVKISKLIEEYNNILKLEELAAKPKILIYCHPYKPDTHWQKDISFPQIVEKYGGNKYAEAIKITIDIKPGGTIKADGFSDNFIENNPFFDYVFLPDCDGVWGKYQKEGKKGELGKLILKLTATSGSSEGEIHFQSRNSGFFVFTFIIMK